MKENTQTLLFLGAAVASILLAAFSQPSDATFAVDELINKPLSRPFDPEEAKALKIVRFDEESATLSEFEVAEQSGVWSLPSKGGYPADAERQMAEATTGVMDLKILGIATQNAADHPEYGVVEPSPELEIGQTGVGTRVVLSKDDGSSLVDVVIGKEIKDAESQHYIRRTTQDAVFIVEINTDRLSTTFEDWIEKDLLGISGLDIAEVRLKDYSAELIQQGFRAALAMDPRADLTLAYNAENSEWLPKKLLVYDREAQDYEPFELADDQQINQEKIDELKTALDDLRIVDVERKPAGLSSDLKAGDDFYENQDSAINLMRRGFAPTNRNGAGEPEILSREGEVIVTQDDGVEYVLRFGNLQMTPGEEAKAPAEGDTTEDEGVNRYLFVMARFNDQIIDQPEIELVPELPEPASEETNEEASTTESDSSTSDEADGAQQPDEADETAEPSEQDAQATDELIAEREAVLDRNQRAQDAYQDRVDAAKKRVEQLNKRFGDWYYVIANDVYEKISLGRDEVIKKIASAEEDTQEAEKASSPAGPLSGLPSLPSSLTGGSLNADSVDSFTEAAPSAEATPAVE